MGLRQTPGVSQRVDVHGLPRRFQSGGVLEVGMLHQMSRPISGVVAIHRRGIADFVVVSRYCHHVNSRGDRPREVPFDLPHQRGRGGVGFKEIPGDDDHVDLVLEGVIDSLSESGVPFNRDGTA